MHIIYNLYNILKVIIPFVELFTFEYVKKGLSLFFIVPSYLLESRKI